MVSRQYHLARLFDESQGAMGLYAEAFIHHVRNSTVFEEKLKSRMRQPLKAGKKDGGRFSRLSALETSFDLNKEHKEEKCEVVTLMTSPYKSFLKGMSLGAFLNEHLRYVLEKMNDEMFLSDEDEEHELEWFLILDKQCPHAKLTQEDFPRAAKQIFEAEESNEFIWNPQIIIQEAITTLDQIMRWVCMHSKTEEELMIQMKAMLEPTVLDPRKNKMITPLEMLGYGNNAYIGEEIDDRFPYKIDGEYIITQATTENPDIIHPRFAAFWFDRDLDVGGCPALVQQARTRNVFVDFGRMYIECAEKLIAHSDRLKIELQKTQEQDNRPEF